MPANATNNGPDKHNHSSSGSKGNASNPEVPSGAEPQHNQLLNEKAEKYLREAVNIEDMPDAQDEEEADAKNNSGF